MRTIICISSLQSFHIIHYLFEQIIVQNSSHIWSNLSVFIHYFIFFTWFDYWGHIWVSSSMCSYNIVTEMDINFGPIVRTSMNLKVFKRHIFLFLLFELAFAELIWLKNPIFCFDCDVGWALEWIEVGNFFKVRHYWWRNFQSVLVFNKVFSFLLTSLICEHSDQKCWGAYESSAFVRR